jgi:hypothetical protein
MEEKKKSWFQRHWILTVILGVMVLGIMGGSLNKTSPISGNSDKTSDTNQQIETSILHVNAEQLIQDYLSNQISADEKYQDKIVSVSGTIYEVGQDWSGGNYIMLRNDYEYNGVQCEFKTKDELMNLYKGEYITLKGKVIGFTKGLVLIDDCSVVN